MWQAAELGLRRRRDDERFDTGGLRGHHIHHHARRVDRITAGDIEPDPLDRHPTLGHSAARHNLGGGVGAPLIRVHLAGAFDGDLECGPHRRVELFERGIELGGGHPHTRRGHAIELLAELQRRRYPAITNRLHHRPHVMQHRVHVDSPRGSAVRSSAAEGVRPRRSTRASSMRDVMGSAVLSVAIRERIPAYRAATTGFPARVRRGDPARPRRRNALRWRGPAAEKTSHTSANLEYDGRMSIPRVQRPEIPDRMTWEELQRLPEEIAEQIELWDGRVVWGRRGPAEHQKCRHACGGSRHRLPRGRRARRCGRPLPTRLLRPGRGLPAPAPVRVTACATSSKPSGVRRRTHYSRH